MTEPTVPAPASTTGRLRHRWLWIGSILAVLLSLTAAIFVERIVTESGRGFAAEAVVTAGSTALGTSPRDAVDSGSSSAPGAGWESDGQTAGAWIDLAWPTTHEVRQLVIVRNPTDEPGVTGGFLAFGDGSFLQLTLSTTTRETIVAVSPRTVDRLRFTASTVSTGAQSVIVDEILVRSQPPDDDIVIDSTPDGNSAADAVLSHSPGTSEPGPLGDGSGVPGSAGTGADWIINEPRGAWVQLDWSRPRELTGVAIAGSSGSTAGIGAATVTFDDGSRLPVGAVLNEPDRPTVVSFMPRLVRSMRLTIDGVDGSGSLALGELRAYQRGATPIRTPAGSGPASSTPDEATCVAPDADAGDLVVGCASPRSSGGAVLDLPIASAPGYSLITATVFPADPQMPAMPVVTAVPSPSGAATLPLNLAELPPGPFSVAVEASGPGRETRTVYSPQYLAGAAAERTLASSAPADGRTLAYAEEFDRPLALSRNGIGADYATGKPTAAGAEDFGDAVFADAVLGFDTVSVVDNRYLRIDVEPTPTGFVDPQGWGRTHLGGMLASARQGGSGFAAQYGYFEARMLAPAAPGTWPAFWMLPSDNLIAPTPVVAEIDAVELYGHDPLNACHSTHDYRDGRDDGVGNCGQRFATERDAFAWHTYGVSITPTANTFYIDGRVVATAPQVTGGGAPMFFLVNLALGGGWPVELQGVQERVALYVDYVRVYV